VGSGVIVPEIELATYAVAPDAGVATAACGPLPTRIAFPAFLVVRFAGVTVADA
jgi:hypothetical protein